MIRGKFLTSMDNSDPVLEIRRNVFSQEDGLPRSFAERDAYDDMAVYALVFDDSDRPAGSGRLYVDADARIRLDRVCVLADARGQKLGDLLMRMLLFRVQEMQLPDVCASVPMDVVPFFARYGFRPTGAIACVETISLREMRATADEIDIEGSCGGHKSCAGCTSDCMGCSENCADCAGSGADCK